MNLRLLQSHRNDIELKGKCLKQGQAAVTLPPNYLLTDTYKVIYTHKLRMSLLQESVIYATS